MKRFLYKTLLVLSLLNVNLVMAAEIDYSNICGNSGVSSAMVIIGYILLIAKWIVPLIIIVLGMVDFGKAAISNDEKAINKASGALVRRFIAGIVIFFVPTIISAFTKNILKTNVENEFLGCTSCMFNPVECQEQVKLLKEQEKEDAANKREELEQDRTEQEEQERQEEEEKQQQSTPTPSGPSVPSTATPSVEYIDVSTLGCTVYYDIYKGSKMTRLGFDKNVIADMRIALKNTCSFVNSSPYMDWLQSAGSYVNRNGGIHDYHARGRAIDLNNHWSIEVNGKTYRPYPYQGTSTWNAYKKFICEVCDGKEDCKYNVNYQIYYKYFRPLGWCWGGNWSPEWFDPMHYELRDGGCSEVNKRTITCS